MQISPELKQRLQVVMLVAILVSGARLAYILYQRHESRLEQAKKLAELTQQILRPPDPSHPIHRSAAPDSSMPIAPATSR